MHVVDWLLVITLSGVLGATGQLARVVVGLKKANDEADVKGTTFNDVFVPSRLIVSLLIGFIAGVLAGLFMQPAPGAVLQTNTVLGFVAAGYMGTDFIEGIMSRYLPGGGGSQPQPQPAPKAAPAAAGEFKG